VAIEDHPVFAEWSQALDDLKAAKDNLQHAVVFNEPSGAVEAARRDVITAQIAFNKLCDQVA
jgi:hypothetical protein